ncbi:hypothetical protein [Streptomyces sp. NBC_01508]
MAEKKPKSGVRNETAVDRKDSANTAKQQQQKRDLVAKMKAKTKRK